MGSYATESQSTVRRVSTPRPESPKQVWVLGLGWLAITPEVVPWCLGLVDQGLACARPWAFPAASHCLRVSLNQSVQPITLQQQSSIINYSVLGTQKGRSPIEGMCQSPTYNPLLPLVV